MSLITTFNVGRLRCHALEAGIQRLDGGAMFGVVPKPLWEDRIAPDELNRISLAMRCLLIEHETGPVLVDTGLGNKEKQKFLRIYGVENSGRTGPTQLNDALLEAGVMREDVRWVINTHLHFDHAGGNTYVGTPEGRNGGRGGGATDVPTFRPSDASTARVAFPNATYVVQRGELDFAAKANERTSASYLAPNFEPVSTAGMWELVEGEVEILPGIRLLPTPGHVPFHQSVVISDAGETACFLGDLVPTAEHVPLPWIMGYDLEPMVTLETKRDVLGRAAAEGWMMVFEHDPRVVRSYVERDSKSFCYKELDTLVEPT
jgi:glyoxylase-like metal-dependent hydrolase (beta-lactamase superfamily II)